MKLRNPSGRAVKLDVVTTEGVLMGFTIGPGATVDLTRYQRALDALAWAEKDEEQAADPTP